MRKGTQHHELLHTCICRVGQAGADTHDTSPACGVAIDASGRCRSLLVAVILRNATFLRPHPAPAIMSVFQPLIRLLVVGVLCAITFASEPEGDCGEIKCLEGGSLSIEAKASGKVLVEGVDVKTTLDTLRSDITTSSAATLTQAETVCQKRVSELETKLSKGCRGAEKIYSVHGVTPGCGVRPPIYLDNQNKRYKLGQETSDGVLPLLRLHSESPVCQPGSPCNTAGEWVCHLNPTCFSSCSCG